MDAITIIAELKIKQALENGDFDNLPRAGRIVGLWTGLTLPSSAWAQWEALRLPMLPVAALPRSGSSNSRAAIFTVRRAGNRE